MELTPRLKKIAGLLPNKAKTLVDIGTDHAYLPVYCLLNGICENAIAMDVNEGPLKRAEENTKKYNLEDKISLRLSDGIQKLKKGEADVIVIAGMGGLLIQKILEEGKDILTLGTKLILQPMIAQEELREYLFSNGYAIENEYVVSEGSKFYNIFCATFGKETKYCYDDIIVGRNLKKNSPEIFEDYVTYKMNVLQKIITGMEKSASEKNTADVKRELDAFKRSKNDED